MIAVAGARIVTPFETIERGVILVDGGTIVAVEAAERTTLPPDVQLIAAPSLTVAPGLIDLHTHGGAAVEATNATPDELQQLAAFYAEHGVTGFLVGVWGSNAHIEAGINSTLAVLQAPTRAPGAAILGLFLEGPFINPARAGAFPPDTIVPPDPGLLARYLERAAGHLRLMTLAPELPGADAVIQHATAHGVVCAAGHSAATWAQAMVAADRGVRHATHTFNAMGTLHHREPGLLGAALADDRFTAELIADGVHVHPAAASILVRAKRVAGAVLITDSIAAAGLPDGDYHIAGLAITVTGGVARLADGTLAGSTLTMDQGIRNVVAWGAATLPEALAMASYNAARVLGVHDRKGRVAPGYDADLVAFDDALTVQWTMVGGELVYGRGGA